MEKYIQQKVELLSINLHNIFIFNLKILKINYIAYDRIIVNKKHIKMSKLNTELLKNLTVLYVENQLVLSDKSS